MISETLVHLHVKVVGPRLYKRLICLRFLCQRNLKLSSYFRFACSANVGTLNCACVSVYQASVTIQVASVFQKLVVSSCNKAVTLISNRSLSFQKRLAFLNVFFRNYKPTLPTNCGITVKLLSNGVRGLINVS